MSIARLLQRVREERAELFLDDVRAVYCRGAVTPELRELLHAHKPQITEFLEAKVLSVGEVEAMRVEVLALAVEADFPELELQPGETVHPGMRAWVRCVHRASPNRLLRAKHLLEARLATAGPQTGAMQRCP